MNPKILVATIAAALGALAIAAPAGATTFCVPTFHAACADDGTNVAEADLQTAMQSQGSDGVADTVLIAPGTITDPDSIEPSGTDALTVRGAGPDQTRLTTSSTNNIYVVNLYFGGNSRQITIEDLTIEAPASLPNGGGAALQNAGDTLDNVDIESLNPGSSGIPSWADSGGVFRNGEIRAAGSGTLFDGIRANTSAGTVTIEDSVIDHPVTGVSNNGTTGDLTVRRTTILDPTQSAVTASAGTTRVENTVIETQGSSAIYGFINSAANLTIEADHVTAVNDGGAAAAAVGSQVMNGQSGDATVNVHNSILRGYAAAYLRSTAAAGEANLALDYTNVAVTGSEVDSGPGTLDFGTGNNNADPLFVSASDFALQPGSPSIDAGDPAAGGLTEDFLGAPRPTDGDGSGTATRDQGAFEHAEGAPPPPPDPPADPPADPADPGDPANPGDKSAPETLMGKGPKKRITSRRAKFEFSSEPGATFRCSLDGNPITTCTSPTTVRRLKRGKHAFTAAAVDAAGNLDPTPVRFRFRVKPR